MSVQLLDTLINQSERLTLDEQLALALRLINALGWVHQHRSAASGANCGLFPYPLTGEDAQTWVTRTRQRVMRSAKNNGAKAICDR